MFKNHPIHVRKRIALLWTIVIAVILFAVLIIVYTGKKAEKKGAPASRFKDFYETISDTTQSFFGAK